jgi:hypothetical protein
MLVRFTFIADGPGPSEAIIGVQTTGGQLEEVVLSKRHTESGLLNVGSPLLTRDQNYLIELPRESTSGKWRVWVPHSETVTAPELHAAE